MSVDVWSCYWNPEIISTVEAQAAWMVPKHGEGPPVTDEHHLLFSDIPEHEVALVSRIAVVERGVVPFSRKIKRAQVFLNYK